MKNHLLYFFLLFPAMLLRAQKSSRATEAFLDEKYVKAADLYEDALKKDSISVVAHVGLTKTRLKQYEAKNQLQPISDYIFCLKNLKKAKYLFSYIDKDDKKILNEKLSFFSANQVEDLLQSISSILWHEFFSKNKNIDSVQLFYDEYAFEVKIKEEAIKLLSLLHYARIQYSNNLKDFQEFVNRFKSFPETVKALEHIQRIEIADALLNGSVQSLESTLSKYPNSSRTPELKSKLAKIYFSTVTPNSEESEINRVVEQLKLLNVTQAVQFIDSCTTFLFKSGYKKLVNSNNVDSIRSFLAKHSKFKNEDEYIEVKKRKLDLIFTNLNSSSSSMHYSDLHEFINEAPADYDGMSGLLNIVITDINFNSLARLDNCIMQFIEDSVSISSAYKGALFKLLRDQFLTNFFIDTSSVYEVIKQLDNHFSEDEYITGIIINLGLIDQLNLQSISVRSIYSDEIGIVTLRTRLSNDSTIRRQYFLSNSDETYVLAPDLVTNLPIYAGISRKNEIITFTKPELVGYSNGQFEVQVFGLKASDARCCPSSRVIIAYEDSYNGLTPKSLRSLSPSEGDIYELEDGEYHHLNVALASASGRVLKR